MKYYVIPEDFFVQLTSVSKDGDAQDEGNIPENLPAELKIHKFGANKRLKKVKLRQKLSPIKIKEQIIQDPSTVLEDHLRERGIDWTDTGKIRFPHDKIHRELNIYNLLRHLTSVHASKPLHNWNKYESILKEAGVDFEKIPNVYRRLGLKNWVTV